MTLKQENFLSAHEYFSQFFWNSTNATVYIFPKMKGLIRKQVCSNPEEVTQAAKFVWWCLIFVDLTDSSILVPTILKELLYFWEICGPLI
jgi:hypothetical protein